MKPAPALRIVSADELRATVGFEELIEPVAYAFRESSAGRASSDSVVMWPASTRERGDTYVKTGVLEGFDFHMVKVAPWYASNSVDGRPQGGFLALLDSATGHTRAVLTDEHYLSDIRTAAAGALAARLLAPASIERATVLGAGVQAYWQTLALHRERPFRSLTVWARSGSNARALVDRLSQHLSAVKITIATDLEDAVRIADVLITTTASREPLVRGDWLHPGQHITAVGADDVSKCELDAVCLHRARVFVDSVDATSNGGDVHRAIRESRYCLEQLAGEIGDLLLGNVSGRTSAVEITIAKFVGLGVQDLVAASVVVARLPH